MESSAPHVAAISAAAAAVAVMGAAAAAAVCPLPGGCRHARRTPQVYEDPTIVDRACRTSFLIDLAWLAFYGVVLRLATYLVLLFKVERRMTSASIFG